MTNKIERISEKKIARILADLDITYVRELSIKDLIADYNFEELHPVMSAFRFDYFLPSKNMMIEFDGGQHFKAVQYFDKDTSLEVRLNRDFAKINFCKLNNIKLIRFDFNTLNLTAVNTILEILAEEFFAIYYVKNNKIIKDYSRSELEIDYDALHQQYCDNCNAIINNKTSTVDTTTQVTSSEHDQIYKFMTDCHKSGLFAFDHVPIGYLYNYYEKFWLRKNRFNSQKLSLKRFNNLLKDFADQFEFELPGSKMNLDKLDRSNRFNSDLADNLLGFTNTANRSTHTKFLIFSNESITKDDYVRLNTEITDYDIDKYHADFRLQRIIAHVKNNPAVARRYSNIYDYYTKIKLELKEN